MKSILKTKQSLSLPIKLAIASLFVVAISSLYFAIKYSNSRNKTNVVLDVDVTIPLPSSSVAGGYYTKEFNLSLTSEKNHIIYYTLDGSEPNLNSDKFSNKILICDRSEKDNQLSAIPTSPRWKPPLGNIFKGIVLRAICVNQNKKSNELVQTFFIKEKKYSFPIIALTINEDDFFGYRRGIYVMGKNYEDKRDYIRKKLPLSLNWWQYPSNYLKRGINSERIANLEFYDNDGVLAIDTRVGVRINGNATRGFSQKSLRICFDEKYGVKELNYELFPGYKVTKFSSIILRNGGNDWSKTMFRDVFMQSIMKSYLDVQEYRPSIVFLNGEYWGIHNIQERIDEDYFANKYSLSKDSISILEFNGDVFYGNKKDNKAFNDLIDFIKNNDLREVKNYEYVEKQMDVNSFMDFVIANVFFCNSDWPNNNVKYWRFKANESILDTMKYKDGRWRWVLYDTDWGFGYTGSESVQLNLLTKATKTGSIGIIFSGLLKNKLFVDKFKARFHMHLKSTFDVKELISKINHFQKMLEPEIDEHINRWRVIESHNQWLSNVNEMKIFAQKRPEIQKQQLDSFFEGLNSIQNADKK